MNFQRSKATEAEISRCVEEDGGEQWYVRCFESVPSTMDVCREGVISGDMNLPALVLADRQTAGRGRRGREWITDSGSLAVTYALGTGRQTIESLSGLSLAVGVIVCHALEQHVRDGREGGSLNVGLKWPNDLVSAAGEKFSGILVEIVPRAGSSVALVGIGMNLVSAPGDVPGATTLAALTGEAIEAPRMAACLASALRREWARFRSDGFRGFREEFLLCAYGRGGKVAVDCGEESYSGIFDDIDDTGALLLRTAHGVKKIASGTLRVMKA